MPSTTMRSFFLRGDVDKVVLVEAGSEKQAQVPAAWEAPVICQALSVE